MRLILELGAEFQIGLLLLIPDDQSTGPAEMSWPPNLRVERLRILHYLPRLGWGALTRQLADVRRLRQVVRSFAPDAVVAVKTPTLMLLAPALLGYRGNLVAWEHRRARTLREGLSVADRYVRWQHLFSLKRCSHVVALDSESLLEYRRLGLAASTCVSNPLPGSYYSVPLERVREPVVLVLARHSPEKRLTLILNAWKSSQLGALGYRLVLAGDGPLRQELEELAGDDPGIQFLGLRQDAQRLLEQATAVVLCSEYELQPVVAVEALAVGTPLLISASAAKNKSYLAGAEIVSDDDWVAALDRIPRWTDGDKLRRMRSGREAVHDFRSDLVASTWSKLLHAGGPRA